MTTHIPHTQPRSRLALPVILTGTFMVVLDFFIVNVALPSMRSGLHASATALQWVVAGYALTSAVLLMASGRLGGRFGRRRVFTAGLALFTVSSAACGIAPSAGFLVVARLVQGGAAALLMPNVLALIAVLYPGPERARALSIYGMVMGVAAAGGQLLGGALVQSDLAGLGWRTVFLINLPIGLAALVLVGRSVPESRDPDAGGLDLAGTALITAALAALVLPLIEGRQLHWPVWTIACLAATPLLLAELVVHLRRRRAAARPALVDLGLLRRRAVSAGLGAQAVFWCGQASFFLVLALYLQSGRGLSALDAGLVFTILAVAYLGGSALAPQLTIRHGRRVLATGAATLATGHIALVAAVAAVGTGGSIVALVPGLVLVGAGMGLGITPLATIVLGAAGPEAAGPASDLLATVQNVGNAVGVAVVGIVFFGRVAHGYANAFGWSEAILAVALVAVVALTRLLPGPEPRAEVAPLGAEAAA
jgi:EmrB/QacA subfamily drug resistance transporter